MSRKVKELQMDDFSFKPSLSSSSTNSKTKKEVKEGYPIEMAKMIVFKQMKIEGLRDKTLITYNQAFDKFIEFINVQYVEEIDREKLMDWLESLSNVNVVTKANRLRFISTILNRFRENNWVTSSFWKDIRIKVPKKTQPVAQENELEILISLIDSATWLGFRDICILLLLYRTGIRVNTLVSLREHHIDFENKELALSGDIMKNGRNLRLPLDDQMLEMLSRLIKQNHVVRKRYRERNDFVFITKTGKTCQSLTTNNNSVTKRLHYYSKKYNLSISPHKIRRLYATNLLKKGANISVISSALGHSSLTVTEKYLSLNDREISDSLRKFL